MANRSYDFDNSRYGRQSRPRPGRGRARGAVRSASLPSCQSREGVTLRTWSVPVSVSSPRRRFKFNTRKLHQNTNNNNDFRKEPFGGILKSFHGSSGEDGAWNRPAGLFKQPLPPSISQNKNCIFPVPEVVQPGLKDKVLFELSAGSGVRQRCQPAGGVDANGQRMKDVDEDSEDDDSSSDMNDSSWSVVLMVVAASVRLFYEMWQSNFDCYMLDENPTPSFSMETQL